jgi:hypothetical protein
MSETILQVWHFDFGVSGQDGQMIAQSDCDQLLDIIIDWAEEHGLCIGGGFAPYDDSN